MTFTSGLRVIRNGEEIKNSCFKKITANLSSPMTALKRKKVSLRRREIACQRKNNSKIVELEPEE
jgi:hypothetical protein